MSLLQSLPLVPVVNVFSVDVGKLKEGLRARMREEPSLWKCPCDDPSCGSHVVFGRSRAQPGSLLFVMNTSSELVIHVVSLNTPDDVDTLPRYPYLPAWDREVIAYYLSQGLRRVLRAAFGAQA